MVGHRRARDVRRISLHRTRRACTGLGCLAIGALAPAEALAYVGPGGGITLIGALWAVLVAVVLTVFGLVWWPLRALLRKRKAAGDADAGGEAGAADETDPPDRL